MIGLSILSGSHLAAGARRAGPLLAEVGVDAPVVVGGIIPEEDRPLLAAAGVAAVYTPKDFELARIMGDIADLAEAHPRPGNCRLDRPDRAVPNDRTVRPRRTPAGRRSTRRATGPDSKLVMSA